MIIKKLALLTILPRISRTRANFNSILIQIRIDNITPLASHAHARIATSANVKFNNKETRISRTRAKCNSYIHIR